MKTRFDSARYQPDLLTALAASRDWRELYQDDVAVLYWRGPCGGE